MIVSELITRLQALRDKDADVVDVITAMENTNAALLEAAFLRETMKSVKQDRRNLIVILRKLTKKYLNNSAHPENYLMEHDRVFSGAVKELKKERP